MEIVSKVMEKSWKSHGNLLVKMCTNPDETKSSVAFICLTLFLILASLFHYDMHNWVHFCNLLVFITV